MGCAAPMPAGEPCCSTLLWCQHQGVSGRWAQLAAAAWAGLEVALLVWVLCCSCGAVRAARLLHSVRYEVMPGKKEPRKQIFTSAVRRRKKVSLDESAASNSREGNFFCHSHTAPCVGPELVMYSSLKGCVPCHLVFTTARAAVTSGSPS